MKINLLLSLLFANLTVAAQENTAGQVKYEQTVKLEIKLEGEAAQFASMLPKERKSNKILHFNLESSLYQNGEAASNDAMSMDSGGNQVSIQVKEPENVLFTDLGQKTTIEQREFMTRIFLIEGKNDIQWKLTGNQKMILDYPCQEAVTEIDSTITSTWFTPAIPVSAGPANYSGLPGLVLLVDSDNGKKTIVATEVEFSEVDAELLSAPKKGKKVSGEEFQQIVEEKMKEMGAQKGEGGHVMIRIAR